MCNAVTRVRGRSFMNSIFPKQFTLITEFYKTKIVNPWVNDWCTYCNPKCTSIPMWQDQQHGLQLFPCLSLQHSRKTTCPCNTFLRPRSTPILNLETFARGFNLKHLSFTGTLSVRGVQIQKCRGGFSNWFRFKTVQFHPVTATYSVWASLLGTDVEFRAVILRNHSRLSRTGE
jgi:hypothetical protein